jgi:hypothetical protein
MIPMFPQGYPMKLSIRFEEDSEWVEAPVVGWQAVEDGGFQDTEPGSRYAPVVLLADDHYGAWPVPTDGSVRWRVVEAKP